MNEGVTLHELAERVPGRVTILGATTSVVDVTRDSREVLPGLLFVAVRGDTIDGHDYVNDAVTRGAVAVAVEEEVAVDVPQLLVADTRRALPWLSATVHGDLSLSTPTSRKLNRFSTSHPIMWKQAWRWVISLPRRKLFVSPGR